MEKAKTIKTLSLIRPMIGCDPEIFFQRNGKIIGAEKVIPEKGISSYYQRDNSNEKIVLDGVQAELNPSPDACRALLANKIQLQFRALRNRLKELGDKDLSISFSSVVEVSKDELDSLSDQAKVFGCAVSKNRYDKRSKVRVDARKYLKRSAGGHIHLGFSDNKRLMENREKLVPLLDVMVGIPSVLIDRDPNAIERRRVYGRAGEYRLPKHGLEYRTLSNFWLRAYPLASLMWAQARNAVAILDSTLRKQPKQVACPQGIKMYSDDYWNKNYPPTWNASKELLKEIDLREVRRAINRNDLTLALKVFGEVSKFITKYMPKQDGLNASNLKEFDFFCKMIWEKGIEYWFPDESLKHWTSEWEGHAAGWETFVGKIRVKMQEVTSVATEKLKEEVI